MRTFYNHKNSVYESNFALIFGSLALDNVICIKTGDAQMQLKIKNAVIERTSPGSDQTMQFDLEELVNNATDGQALTLNVDYLSANKDMSGVQILTGVELLKDGSPSLTYDRTGARNMFRHIEVVNSPRAVFSNILDFNYSLKPNTTYLFNFEILNGTLNATRGYIYGELVRLK